MKNHTVEFGVNNYVAMEAVSDYLDKNEIEYTYEYDLEDDFYRFFVSIPSEEVELKILQVRDEATRKAICMGVLQITNI